MNTHRRLGEMLIERELVSQVDLDEALRRQAGVEGWKKLKIGGILVVMGAVKAKDNGGPREAVNRVLAEQTDGLERICDIEQAQNLQVSIRFPVTKATPIK